jgi:hypothetical protein
MNREQRQTLVNELWERDEPHVMIVRYDDEAERIGTQGTTTTFHANPIQAIDAFFCLLGPRQYHDHPALNDNLYRWLIAHSDSNPEEPSANDLVGDVMFDLTEDNTLHHPILALEIIPLLEYHTRDHGTLAERLERTTDLPLVPMSEYTYGFNSDPPLPDDDMLIDTEDVVMFDHTVPPPGLEIPLPDDETGVQYLSDEAELFATPTPGSVQLPAANHAPAPPPTATHNAPALSTRARGPRVPRPRVNTNLGLDARRIHACTFQGCSSRFTRPSDLARHWRDLHPGHPQQ